jgi:putative ABC transport system ATP-binding protein
MIDQSISRYIWTHTKPQQVWILFVVVASMVPIYMSFDLPKQIVNGPIQGEGFETPGATQLFLRWVVNLPGLGEVTLLPGWELGREGMLFALSGVFLALVIINGLIKYYINTYKGRLGERLLRRLRYTLVDMLLRFPPVAFKRLKPAEVASMVKDEVEPMGGFAGDAFVAPVFLGGQALTALVFIFVQSVMLGLVTLFMVAVQFVIIPRMRRRLLVLGRERQLTARQLAGRVSEVVEGINTVRTYGATNWERADIAHRLGRIFKIRFDIYQWKFMVKFINNFLASLTPFFFYAVGGFLALRGHLDIGQLVAVIGAYKDLPGPLKELIDWDQNRQDVQVKYQTVVQQFAVEGLIDPTLQAPDPAPGALPQPLAAVNLGVTDDTGAASLTGVNFQLHPQEIVAVVGTTGGGGDVLAEALVRVTWPSSGKVAAGDHDLLTLPDAVAARAITYAGPDAFFVFGTVRENLLYGLRHAPVAAATYEGAAARQRDWEIAEARLSGNPDFDVNSDWVDYRGAGIAGAGELGGAVLGVLDAVGLTRDILDLALRSPVEPGTHDDLCARIVGLRGQLREQLRGEGLADLVVPFEPGSYNAEATVFDNLLFGNPRLPAFQAPQIIADPTFRAVLDRGTLGDRLAATGQAIAVNGIELFGDLPADHPLFAQQNLIAADDIPVLRQLLQRLERAGGTPSPDDRMALIRLTFAYVEPRHRFGLMTPALAAEIVGFRRALVEALPSDRRDGIESFDPGRYMASASLLDNLLFGRISQKYRDGSDRVQAAVMALLPSAGLQDEVLEVGLDFHVGQGGKRLTAAQRQKLALARALLRRSDYYVLNRPLSALDPRTHEATVRTVIDRLRAQGAGVAWVLPSAVTAPLFDRVAVFDGGRLAEAGPPAALAQKNGIFADMIRT